MYSQTLQLALLIWKDRIVYHIRDNDLNRLLYQVFEFIRRDRDGEEIPSDVVNVVVKSLGNYPHIEQHKLTSSSPNL